MQELWVLPAWDLTAAAVEVWSCDGETWRSPAMCQVLAADFQPYIPGLYVLIGAGALMMLIGLFGCCGAARESQCLIGAFFACLLVIFAAEVTAGAVSFLGKAEAVKKLKNTYHEAYKAYQKNGSKNTTLSGLHKMAKCCGTEDPASITVLKPLCSEKQQEYKNCLVEIEKTLSYYFHIVGILAIATAGITIFGMIFSMVLCCAIRNSRDML
ncbi:tetraspanin-2 isoform X2 [Xenopus laevis]|uniref:Tetraspanin-2 isoform X2 n=1 Tax=Xenopus laevis TaxID=8355 RepID=A0A8J1MD47_XENLA|nr:tetraspanin-2 isoform X2 [Xenopus laevis]